MTPAPAQAALKAIWGPLRLNDGSSAFPVYRKLGVDVLQLQVRWREVATRRPVHPRNPSDPAYRWPRELDEATVKARRSGIRVALMMITTPDWANGGRGPKWAPKAPSDLADFAAAAAKRYTRVRHWMVWGEPANNLLPMPEDSPRGPRVYARMLDRTYAALKRVRRSNVVIGGMSWTVGAVRPADFLRWMRLPSGRSPRLDWYGHNPFGYRFPDLRKPPYISGLRDMSDVDTLIREVRRAYRPIHRRPRLWLSEYTIPSERPDHVFNFSVSRRGQARYLAAAFRIARKHRYIAGIGWFSLLDEPESTRSFKGGLMTADGRPKPSFYAYQRARL